MIPRTEWDARIKEQDELKSRLEMRERQFAELQSELAAYREQGATGEREAAAMKAESDAADWQRQARQQSEKIALLEATNTELRDNISALSENLDDKMSALHLAENTRARLEQEQLKLQDAIRVAQTAISYRQRPDGGRVRRAVGGARAPLRRPGVRVAGLRRHPRPDGDVPVLPALRR